MFDQERWSGAARTAPAPDKNDNETDQFYNPDEISTSSDFVKPKKLSRDLEQECLIAMEANGLTFEGFLVADGKLHRYSCDKKKNEPDEWYVAYSGISQKGNPYLNCVFGTWSKGGEKFYFNSWKNNPALSKEELQAIKKQWEEQKKLAEEEDVKETELRSGRAKKAWNESSDRPNEAQQYLDHKKVGAHGIRFGSFGFNEGSPKAPNWIQHNTLVIPLRNIEGALRAVQYIRADGEKRIYGPKRGNFHLIGEVNQNSRILVAEGYSTGVTAYELTGDPVAIAFDCGNLDSVIHNLRQKYPKNPILILGDDDVETVDKQEQPFNPGRIKAEAAARKHCCQATFPKFPDEFRLPGGNRPTDWNDLLVHFGSDEVKRQLGEAKTTNTPKLPNGFFFQADLLWYQPNPKSNAENEEEDGPPPIRICSKLEITALTRDENQENHGVLLELLDPDKHPHKWAMPMELLAGSGDEYRRHLLSLGLRIDPGSKPRSLLTAYIQGCAPLARVRCVSRPGWHGNCFVLNDQVIGLIIGHEQVLFQSVSPYTIDFSEKGTLDDWRYNVAAPCRGNSRLVFSVSLAFASPLLEPLEIEGGGFHFKGPSSIGKTTALIVASSVWGGRSYLKTWRTTDNGLEGLCTCHNHTLLVLDELSQYDPEKAGTAAYLIANGQGKGRSNADGRLRKPASWRLVFLSSGEVGLSAHVEEAGKKSKTGQGVRMVDIPADTGIHGLFENLHSRADGDALSRELKEAALSAYGVPSKVFLEKLSKEKDALIPDLKKMIRAFVSDVIGQKKVSGQVSRVAERFALVAVAGELATIFAITGWDSGEATKAAKDCFYAWLKDRGGVANLEEDSLLTQVRLFFALHGESRFSRMDAQSDSKTVNRAGYRRSINGDEDELEFLVFPDVFQSEICKGLSSSHVIKTCLANGFLRPNASGESTHPTRLPGVKKMSRLYVFTSRVLGVEK